MDKETAKKMIKYISEKIGITPESIIERTDIKYSNGMSSKKSYIVEFKNELGFILNEDSFDDIEDSFDDDGEECSNSEECKGGCTIDREFIINNYPEIELNSSGYSGDITCKDACTGTCSEYPLRKCDWWFEVDNGTIIDHTGIFCG